jgi:transcription elongation factor GreA
LSSKENMLTPSGLAKLEKELDYLKIVKRREVAARIKQSLEFGDISENSEYDDAKNEQAYIESRIHQLEKILRNSKVIDNTETETDAVIIGSKVKVKDMDTGEESEFVVVGSAEADPMASLISNESPVGKALMGQKAGAIIKVNVPAGVLTFKILEVSIKE